MFVIECATVDEVNAIKQVLSETWIATYAGHLSRATIGQVTTQWHDPGLLRSQIEKPTGYFAVAKLDGRIVGLITVVESSGHELYLPRLYVLPEYQGRGIGTRLLDAAVAAYPDAISIRLDVEQQNAKAHAYWLGQGFVDIGTSVQQVGTDRLELITMEKRLQ